MQNSADLKKTSVAQDHEGDASTLTQSQADAHSVKTRSIFLQNTTKLFGFQACDTNVPRFSGSLPDSTKEIIRSSRFFRSSKEACQVQNGFDIQDCNSLRLKDPVRILFSHTFAENENDLAQRLLKILNKSSFCI